MSKESPSWSAAPSLPDTDGEEGNTVLASLSNEFSRLLCRRFASGGDGGGLGGSWWFGYCLCDIVVDMLRKPSFD